MAIQKKSLITNLSATKKAVVASHTAAPTSAPATLSPRGMNLKSAGAKSFKAAGAKSFKAAGAKSFKAAGAKSFKSAGAKSMRAVQ